MKHWSSWLWLAVAILLVILAATGPMLAQEVPSWLTQY
jgi:hypothetical protein